MPLELIGYALMVIAFAYFIGNVVDKVNRRAAGKAPVLRISDPLIISGLVTVGALILGWTVLAVIFGTSFILSLMFAFIIN